MGLDLSSDFDVVDARFRALTLLYVRVEKLWRGCRWAEGPAWFGGGRYLVWSDIPNDRVLRWDETDGSVSVFRQPSLNANGHAVDRQGRLVSCEHRGRCISRTEHDGSGAWCSPRTSEGRRFNSPNDAVVKSDGTIWFSDPSYGIDSDYEGDAADNEMGAQRVYRIAPEGGQVSVVADDFVQPNGLAFSPDESLLYIVDTGATHVAGGPHHVRRFRVGPDGVLTGGEVFAECPVGLYDGLRVDVHGNLWLSAGDGVHCHAPDGTLLGRIRIPEPVANLCFGGPKLNRLFVCATSSLYSVYLNTRGC